MDVTSPLTGTADITLEEKIPVSLIKNHYQNDFSLDVSNYLKDITEVEIYKCNVSGYRFYYPYSLEAKSSFYELLMTHKESYYYDWKWENGIASQFIKDNDKVLDVGCGDGAFLRGLLKRRGISADGLELNPKALEIMKRDGLSVFQNTVQEYASNHKDGYDVVTSFQVLEHIADVKSFLSSKLELLKPGGLMIIGVPYNNPFLYKKDKYHTLNLPPHHMGLWNETAFENLAKIFNARLLEVRIEKVDDFAYYLAVQLGIVEGYKRAFKKNKVVQFISKAINKIGAPSNIKGRNIVVVFKKI